MSGSTDWVAALESCPLADPFELGRFALSKGHLKGNRIGALRLAQWGRLRYGSHLGTAKAAGLHRNAFAFAAARVHSQRARRVEVWR